MFTQQYTLKQSTRGLCQYDDKRYLLSDLTYVSLNPNTNEFLHKDFSGGEELVADMSDGPWAEMLIEMHEERFKRKQRQVVAKKSAR